jgi:hypothetical protein
MKQWFIKLKSGNFENGYYEVGHNFDLVLELVKSEFHKDWIALGFTPVTSEIVYMEQNEI